MIYKIKKTKAWAGYNWSIPKLKSYCDFEKTQTFSPEFSDKRTTQAIIDAVHAALYDTYQCSNYLKNGDFIILPSGRINLLTTVWNNSTGHQECVRGWVSYPKTSFGCRGIHVINLDAEQMEMNKK